MRERTLRSLDLEGTAANRPCTGSARGSEGIQRPSHTWRVRVCATVCGISGGIRKGDDDQWTKRVDQFLQLRLNHPSTQYCTVSMTPSVPRRFSEPSSCRAETRLYRSAHMGRLKDTSRPSEKTLGLRPEVLDSFVSWQSRKSAGIRA